MNLSEILLVDKENNTNKDEIKKIILEIEENALKKTVELYKSGQIKYLFEKNNTSKDTSKDTLKNCDKVIEKILEEGSNDFINKCGRNMTYLEIREMFG